MRYIRTHFKKIKTPTFWVFTTILLLTPLIILFSLLYYNDNKQLELATEIYGAFVATLLGVLASLYLSKQQERERDKKNVQRTMLGSLKVIWSELDINEDIFKNIHQGLNDMPQIPTQLYEQQAYLIKYAEGLKSKAFYATMSSGAINVISEHNEIFNDLQQAYYNSALTQNGMNLTNETYKDLANKTFADQNPTLVKAAFNILGQESKKVERTITMISKAKKSTFDYLIKKGVTFTKEEKKKQNESNKKSDK